MFSFLSGLYFRGKHAYAQMFGRPSASVAAVHIITSSHGLLPPDTRVTRKELKTFAQVDLSAGDDRFRGPLLRDAKRLRAELDDGAEIVLLGSIATGKYVDPLLTPNGVRHATALSRDLRRPRRHEPRRHLGAQRARRTRAYLRAGGWRR